MCTDRPPRASPLPFTRRTPAHPAGSSNARLAGLNAGEKCRDRQRRRRFSPLRLRRFLRHLFALLARLRQADCDGLLAAFHLAAFAALAAFGSATLVAAHLVL